MNFKFFKINIFQGSDRKINGFAKMVFIKPIIDITKYSDKEIKFTITLQIKPDIGELNFNGRCSVYSSNYERFSKMIENYFDNIKQTIKKDILKEAYPHAKRYVKNKGINLPPLDFIMMNIREL